MLEIEKNIPIPVKGTRGRTSKFDETLRVMEVGDSVKFSMSDEPLGEQFRSVALKKPFHYKITRRTSDDKSHLRYWRIE